MRDTDACCGTASVQIQPALFAVEPAQSLAQRGQVVIDRAKFMLLPCRQRGLRQLAQPHPSVADLDRQPHRLRLQKHDSLAYWSPWDLDNVWWIIQTIYRELERPRVYDGVELTIPVGMKCGLNLGEMVEFKKPPTKNEVRQVLEQLRDA